MFIFYILGLFISLCVGFLLGAYDCKRSYGIPKGMSAEQYITSLEMLSEIKAETEDDYDDGFDPT